VLVRAGKEVERSVVELLGSNSLVCVTDDLAWGAPGGGAFAGDNLVRAWDSTILSKYGITLTAHEATELTKMSVLHDAKAFEYFWFGRRGDTPELKGLMHTLIGRPGLPDESVVEGLLIRLLDPKL
jgi:hypothetical protein